MLIENAAAGIRYEEPDNNPVWLHMVYIEAEDMAPEDRERFGIEEGQPALGIEWNQAPDFLTAYQLAAGQYKVISTTKLSSIMRVVAENG